MIPAITALSTPVIPQRVPRHTAGLPPAAPSPPRDWDEAVVFINAGVMQIRLAGQAPAEARENKLLQLKARTEKTIQRIRSRASGRSWRAVDRFLLKGLLNNLGRICGQLSALAATRFESFQWCTRAAEALEESLSLDVSPPPFAKPSLTQCLTESQQVAGFNLALALYAKGAYYLGTGSALISKDFFNRSVRRFEDVIRADPLDKEAMLFCARSLAGAGRHDDAMRVLDGYRTIPDTRIPTDRLNQCHRMAYELRDRIRHVQRGTDLRGQMQRAGIDPDQPAALESIFGFLVEAARTAPRGPSEKGSGLTTYLEILYDYMQATFQFRYDQTMRDEGLTPREFLSRRKGDCEDWAGFAQEGVRAFARAAGQKISTCFIIGVRGRLLGLQGPQVAPRDRAHAVLMVIEPNGAVHAMDNSTLFDAAPTVQSQFEQIADEFKWTEGFVAPRFEDYDHLTGGTTMLIFPLGGIRRSIEEMTFERFQTIRFNDDLMNLSVGLAGSRFVPAAIKKGWAKICNAAIRDKSRIQFEKAKRQLLDLIDAEMKKL